jgi:predicted RNA-binding protein YlxR (DUF448 family)
MPKPRHEPVRTCVACRQEAGKRTLLRLVRGADGVVAVDATGRASGRGAYLHRDKECVELARRMRHLERSLGATVAPDLWSELVL